MATSTFAHRFPPSAGSLAASAASKIAEFSTSDGDMVAAWAIVWQACRGRVLTGAHGDHLAAFPYDFEPVSTILGRAHVSLTSAAEADGARKVLMAMLDLCDRETRQQVFDLIDEGR